jgi:hypothetical protein
MFNGLVRMHSAPIYSVVLIVYETPNTHQEMFVFKNQDNVGSERMTIDNITGNKTIGDLVGKKDGTNLYKTMPTVLIHSKGDTKTRMDLINGYAWSFWYSLLKDKVNKTSAEAIIKANEPEATTEKKDAVSSVEEEPKANEGWLSYLSGTVNHYVVEPATKTFDAVGNTLGGAVDKTADVAKQVSDGFVVTQKQFSNFFLSWIKEEKHHLHVFEILVKQDSIDNSAFATIKYEMDWAKKSLAVKNGKWTPQLMIKLMSKK